MTSPQESIPVATLTYLDERLQSATDEIKKLFADHIEDEEVRYAEILDKIDEKDSHSERRHTALTQAIESYMSKQERIETAFLEHESGKPDYQGHYHFHKDRRAKSLWLDKVRDNVLTKVVEYLAVAVVVWLGITVWVSFLNGPKIGG